MGEGARIRLISNSLIRYDGFLYHINSDENTVNLKSVRIYGTEGRKGGVNEVPPSDQLFEFIVFRGDDIKDLTLYEEDTAAADPAILVATPATRTASQPVQAATKTFATAARTVAQPQPQVPASRNFYDDMYGSGRRGGAVAGGGNQRYGGGTTQNQGRYTRRGGYNSGGGGGGNYRRRHTDGHTGQEFTAATGTQKEEFKEEFDFAKSREEFEKAKDEAKEESHVSKAYTKSSFFDMISCDQKAGQRRADRDEMKKVDADTFGSEMVGSMRGYRRGRGGRGGRGRFNRH